MYQAIQDYEATCIFEKDDDNPYSKEFEAYAISKTLQILSENYLSPAERKAFVTIYE